MTIRPILVAAGFLALAIPLGALAGGQEPVITVPASMAVQAQGFAGATVTYAASAVDGDGRPIPVTCTPPSGSIFGFGRTTVICTARAHGQTRSKQFDITVVDTQPPAITVPAARRVSTTSRSGKVVWYTVSASDVVDGALALNCNPAPGVVFRVGTTTVTCTAADNRGNGAAASFTVTVVLTSRGTRMSTAMLAPRYGATVRAAPMLRWRPAAKARFYNVQLYRRGHKVLTVWPSRPRFRLHNRWTFRGRTYRLLAGNYTWLVWPAFGTLTNPRYGKLLGQSSFVVAKRS